MLSAVAQTVAEEVRTHRGVSAPLQLITQLISAPHIPVYHLARLQEWGAGKRVKRLWRAHFATTTTSRCRVAVWLSQFWQRAPSETRCPENVQFGQAADLFFSPEYEPRTCVTFSQLQYCEPVVFWYWNGSR